MTEEQKRQFDRKVWNSQIIEGTPEYYMVKSFFELGLKLGNNETDS